MEELLYDELEKLNDACALELYQPEPGKVRIPVILNDTMECAWTLEGCTVIGRYDNQDLEDVRIEHTIETERKGLFLHQSEKNVVSIWYTAAKREMHLYQYHRIAHFWVEGQEDWRRLVYMCGTLDDKRKYMGEEYCNETELKLMKLMGFAPFRHWSPINESLDDLYPDSVEAAELLKKLCAQVGDQDLIHSIDRYVKHCTPFINRHFPAGRRWLTAKLAMELTKEKHAALQDYLGKLLIEGSVPWNKRDYGADQEAKYENQRRLIQEKYLAAGYIGSYPEFVKDGKRVVLYEEHPYIIKEAEYDDFQFGIRPIVYPLIK